MEVEERRQLPANEGGCWDELSALITGEESNPMVAFLKQNLAVAASRGDLDYAEKVIQDLTISLLQSRLFEQAKMMSDVELALRKMKLAEKKERESRPSGMQQNLNVNVKDGNMSVDNLQADQVVDIHHNNGVKIEDDGSKGKFH